MRYDVQKRRFLHNQEGICPAKIVRNAVRRWMEVMTMPEYIERETLVSMLDAKSKMAYGTPKMVFCAASKMVELLPAADVAPVVHGKWKFNGDGSGTCNKCGITQKNVWDYDNHQNYCGVCGAIMDEVET